MAIILGIDPGSRITGYGVIDCSSNKYRALKFGQIKTDGTSISERLYQIYHDLSNVINTYQPSEIAIEEVFMHRNFQSALKLGQARGAAFVAAANLAIPVFEYSAREVKKACVGYGAAKKDQVQHMIRMMLNLADAPPADASDALAIAICHANTRTVNAKLKRAIEST